MHTECKLEQQAQQSTLSCRFHSPVEQLPQHFGHCYGLIAKHLAELHQQPAGPPFAIYRNMDMKNLDVEAGFPVASPLGGNGEIFQSSLPEGQIATSTHFGSYASVEETYNALMQWIGERELKPSGPPYEYYLNDPDDTPEDQLQTKVCMPVAGT